MGNKRRYDKHKRYQELTSHGVHVQKHDQIRPNAGSETFRHEIAKLAVGHIGKANDYWVASEVEIEQPGDTEDKEADIILWGDPERLTYAVECETGWTKETKAEKLDQYVYTNPVIEDMLTVEVNDLPKRSMDILDNVSHQLGMYP